MEALGTSVGENDGSLDDDGSELGQTSGVGFNEVLGTFVGSTDIDGVIDGI